MKKVIILAIVTVILLGSCWKKEDISQNCTILKESKDVHSATPERFKPKNQELIIIENFWSFDKNICVETRSYINENKDNLYIITNLTDDKIIFTFVCKTWISCDNIEEEFNEIVEELKK